MTHLERETKLSISPEDYRSLLSEGRRLGSIDQLNVYYHDPSRLGEGTGYFRVRFQEGRDTIATMKILLGWVGDRREMLEIERPLREMGPVLSPRPGRRIRVADDLPREFSRHFQREGIEEIRRIGWIRNLRCLIELPPDGVIEVDRTRFPDGSVNHEVEIEGDDDEAAHQLARRVKALAPSARHASVGKFTRFLRSRSHGP